MKIVALPVPQGRIIPKFSFSKPCGLIYIIFMSNEFLISVAAPDIYIYIYIFMVVIKKFKLYKI